MAKEPKPIQPGDTVQFADACLLRSGQPGDDARRGDVRSLHSACDITAAGVQWDDGSPTRLVNVNCLTRANGLGKA